jgi:hypothetical protein
MKLATFNVCGLPGFHPSFAERAAEYCRRIEASDLALVNFQEVFLRRQLAVIRAHLPSFRHVALGHNLAGLPAGGLVTFSRLPVERVLYRSFLGSRPDTGSPRFRIKRTVNGILQGVLTMALTGRSMLVANTHLTANKDGDWSAGNRYHHFQRTQLHMLHATLRRLGPDDAVLTGDFNLASDGALYPKIVDDGVWHDPFAASDPTTYHREFLPPDYPPHRIDYVLTRGNVSVKDHGVFIDDTSLSDHKALYAELG